MTTTDIIIIGAGPGGYETALEAARAGRRVVIIERGELGGTCLNSGCIPTKCLCHTAELFDATRTARHLGILTTGLAFVLPQAMAHKDEVVARLRQGIAALLKHPLITLVEGEARFVDAHTVEAAGQQFTAPQVIIAVGGQPATLPIEGAQRALTSTDILRLDAQPASLCVIGGGVIGLEMASVFAAFGTRVTVLEFLPEVLPAFDRDIAKRLRLALKKRGIDIHVGAAAQRIDDDGVTYTEKGKEQRVVAQRVLMAVGRRPNLGALNLDDVGIQYTRRGITVDHRMQTTVEGVYAIGDVNGLMPLAHAAAAQGRVALGLTKEVGPVPAAVFTLPEAAMVGATEGTAHKAFYRANGKALTMDADEGLVKIFTTDDGIITGAAILGAHAADLIHEVRVGEPLADLAARVFAHPTLSEIIRDAAR